MTTSRQLQENFIGCFFATVLISYDVENIDKSDDQHAKWVQNTLL
jgi:hypothetical protein